MPDSFILDKNILTKTSLLDNDRLKNSTKIYILNIDNLIFKRGYKSQLITSSPSLAINARLG